MKNTESFKINRTALIATLLAILVVIGLLIYWYLWRPSDNDYQSAAALVTYTEKTHRVLAVELATMQYPGQINASTPIKLQVLASAYKNAVDALNQNGAINRDLAVRSIYDRNKNALTEHSQAMVKLASAVKLYTTTLDKCGLFTDSITDKKTDTYTKYLDECRSAIGDGRASGHKTFNDLFLTEYLDQTTKYVDALDKIMNALNDADFKTARQSADTAYQALSELGEVKLNFESPNVIAITKDLNTSIDSQKKALLR